MSEKEIEKNEEKKCSDGMCCDNKFMKKYGDYLIPGIVILALVCGLIFVFVKNSNFFSKNSIDEGKPLSEKVSKEIEGKITELFKEIYSDIKFNKFTEDKSGLYKINITVQGETADIYLTKDQSKLILQIVDLDEQLKKNKEEKKSEESASSIDENKKALGFSENSKPRLDYFVMSFCPYGAPADANAGEIYKNFGNAVDVVPHYILSLDESAQNGYNSLHGPQEANQDVRELCVLQNFGKAKFFDFVLASNNDLKPDNADTNWKQTAIKLGLDTNIIENCWKTKGLEMVKKEIEISEKLKVNGSPTIFVNGGKSTNRASVIKDSLCKAFPENAKPKACSQEVKNAETNTDASCGK